MREPSNLPPGVSVHDIPGNRPEDAEWEKIEDEFLASLNIQEIERFDELADGPFMWDFMGKAILFGIEVSRRKTVAALLVMLKEAIAKAEGDEVNE